MFKHTKNNNGLTLIEVVVSIIIISIVIISISTLFLQSKKTTASSDQIVDATYIAQEAMEEVYIFSRTQSLTEIHNYFILQGANTLISPTPTNLELSYSLPYTSSHITVEYYIKVLENPDIHLDPTSSKKLFNVIITVKDATKVLSTMENVFYIKL